MSNLPEVCNLCEHADVETPCRPFCAHPDREKQGIVLANSPPPWCPLRGEAKPAEPDGFRILMSPDGQIRRVMFGCTDISSYTTAVNVDLRSGGAAREARIALTGFTLETIDD